MNGIRYYALDENEEVPYEFVVTRNVNGEPEFCASFVNTNSLAYGNGVLLKLHVRNDELRAENANLRDSLKALMMGTNVELCADREEPDCKECSMHHGEDGCTVVDAMELLDIDIYGEPLGEEW